MRRANNSRVSAGRGCKAVVTARTRCGWIKLRECGELLYGRRYPLKLKLTVHKSYVSPAILHGSEAWCLKESEIKIFNNNNKISLPSWTLLEIVIVTKT